MTIEQFDGLKEAAFAAETTLGPFMGQHCGDSHSSHSQRSRVAQATRGAGRNHTVVSRRTLMETNIDLKLKADLEAVEIDQTVTITITGRVSSVMRYLLESSGRLGKGDRREQRQRIELVDVAVTGTGTTKGVEQ
jgi:hypothetical protein